MPPFLKPLLALVLVATGLAASGLAARSAPDRRADAAAGRAIAERWCASCHVVGAGQTQAASDAPPFATLAARGSDLSAQWLAFHLLRPHPSMPQLTLTRIEAADLAAYFASLKK